LGCKPWRAPWQPLCGLLALGICTSLQIAADSSNAYQAVLLTCVTLGSFSLIPMLLIKEEKIRSTATSNPAQKC